MDRCGRSTACRSRFRTRPSPPSWARTAPARRRCCAPSTAWSARAAVASSTTTTAAPASPPHTGGLDLTLPQEKLDKLNALFKVETERYFSFRHQDDITVERLDGRLIDLYENGEPTDLEVLLSAKSFSDLISQTHYLDALSQQDERIAGEVGSAKVEARAQRERTKVFRGAVASETHTIDVRRDQVRSARETLLAEQHGLATARQNRRESLVAVTESKREYVHEVAGLAQASAQLAARLSGASPRRVRTADC